MMPADGVATAKDRLTDIKPAAMLRSMITTGGRR
jgi:hypothetical protein